MVKTRQRYTDSSRSPRKVLTQGAGIFRKCGALPPALRSLSQGCQRVVSYRDNLHKFGSLALSEEPMEFDAALIPFTLFMVALVGLSVGLILLGHLCGPHRSNPVKAMPYESGVDPFHDAQRKFHVRFHVLAIAFVVFDVELLFLYPWVLSLRQANVPQPNVSAVMGRPAEETIATVATIATDFGTNRMASDRPENHPNKASWKPSQGQILWPGIIFFILLGLGYVYDWRRRVLDWDSPW
jgi:NADH:ubiquinone oxidoreductase subunit 3 (subunit A)